MPPPEAGSRDASRGGCALKRATHDHPPRTVRTRAGLQLRTHPRDAITPDAEQRFLLALSATANVRLAARAAGYAHSSFYARRRTDPGFAREWRLALERGYDRVEEALLANTAPEAYAQDAWRHNDPPPVPPMTAAQALQLMYLHQKEARLGGENARLKRRRGEPDGVYWYRVSALRDADLDREREKFRVAEAERQARGEGSPFFDARGLPDLSQVTGWSKADPKKRAHHPERALFGGWRLEDWEEG